MILATILTALAVASVPPTSPPASPTTTAAAAPTTTGVPQPIPEGYTGITDSTESIVVAVPEAWSDVDIAPAPTEGAGEVPYIAASPDLTTFYGDFTTPGVLYAAFPYALNPLDYVEQFGLYDGCETLEVKEYNDPIFVGVIQIGTNCGEAGLTWNMVIASPADHSYTAIVQVQSTDANEIRTVLLTFNTIGGVLTG